MRRSRRNFVRAAALALLAGRLAAAGPFDVKEYAARRARLMDKIGDPKTFTGIERVLPADRFAGPDEVLAPGMVFACDIQLLRLEEEIGIRIEDTAAVTESGCKCLSGGVPRTVAEIEALMRTDGILQVLRAKALI